MIDILAKLFYLASLFVPTFVTERTAMVRMDGEYIPLAPMSALEADEEYDAVATLHILKFLGYRNIYRCSSMVSRQSNRPIRYDVKW